jgi:hypothetical protein
MLMLTAYFDESGKDRYKDKVFTVAGYLSTVQRWKKFEIEWLELLRKSEIEYSHAADMAHSKCQFKKWDSTKRLAFEKDAHKIIKGNTIQPFDMSLLWDDYNELIPTYKGSDPPPAYALLVNALLLEVAKWATENGYYEPISYVFEDGVDDEGWITRAYAKASQDIASVSAFHFASLTFMPGKPTKDERLLRKWRMNGKRVLVQLQAADMNAYEICKARKDEISGLFAKRGRLRGSLDSLRSEHRITTFMGRDAMIELLLQIEKKDLEDEHKENGNETRR